MKNKIAIGVLIFAGIICIWAVLSRNALVEKEETVKKQWANVESQYQRRADLIPNLVNVVRAYASHENSTLTDVVNARAKAIQTTVDLSDFTASDLNNYSKAQSEIGSAIGRLAMISEDYPELKANQNFLDLQVQLEGTENRIAVERMRYNKSVNLYNSSLRKFPTLLVATIFGFGSMPYFDAEADAADAVDVEL